jgi:hypothetical protein
MSRSETVQFEFVESVPARVQDGIIYVSTRFATAIHKCCCGCGTEVATPLSPAGWTLIFDGDTVSLYPSIGNWSMPCKSHYWIRRNHVIWARRWSKQEISSVRRRDQEAYEQHFAVAALESTVGADNGFPQHEEALGWWGRFKKYVGR